MQEFKLKHLLLKLFEITISYHSSGVNTLQCHFMYNNLKSFVSRCECVSCFDNSSDCGLFAIAFAVALCFGLNPSKLIFEQGEMRDHLLNCLKENEFTNFPFSINPMWKKKKIVINKETLFCFCRGLYDSEMAKCISCHEWFHLRCLSSREVKHIKDDVTFQYSCSKCLKKIEPFTTGNAFRKITCTK